MSKAANPIPTARLALYDRLVASRPHVERKGRAMPYTSVNGNMFSFLTKTGALALRLSAEAREAFLKQHEACLCEQHGTVLTEYVQVPDKLLNDTNTLLAYFDASLAYAQSLKPKATRRRTGK